MKTAALLLALAPLALAQNPLRIIRATGTGTVVFRPDQAKINISVVTQGRTAQAASDENATKADAVIRAVSAAAGPSPSVRTIAYVITPLTRNLPGQQSEITGYQATNTIEVTMSDTGAAGRVIDAGVRAGATSFSGLRFLLANPEPARLQALTAAGKQARDRASAIAAGLGRTAGNVISAAESSVFVPTNNLRSDVGAAAISTPIEVGNLEVSATITIEVELQ